MYTKKAIFFYYVFWTNDSYKNCLLNKGYKTIQGYKAPKAAHLLPLVTLQNKKTFQTATYA